MTEFNKRLEGEIKTHEKEMLKKVVTKKYGDKPLHDRVIYVMKTYPKESWTAEEMYDKLSKLQIHENISIADIKYHFTSTGYAFPAKITE